MKRILMAIMLAAALPACKEAPHFTFGTAVNPHGETILVDSKGFIINGERTIPVAGEMHFQRIPPSEWRNELLKVKAGGVTILSTYVFWGYMEPVEGEFDFTGRNNIREFLEECGRCGLKVLLRAGPWAHGEWSLGGLPEWTIDKWNADPGNYRVRSMAPGFIASVKRYFDALGEQVEGLMWKDGGPVVGFQIDNECFGPWEYMNTVKKLAVEAGFDLPFYTKTFGPHIEEGEDKGEMLPLGGNYVDGFWNGELTDMPAQYNESFEFRDPRWNADPEGGAGTMDGRLRIESPCPLPGLSYPHLMCELGTGMMTSYHRRIRIYDTDIRASVVTRIGQGTNMPGYFMYHGGTNPWKPDGTYAERRDSRYTNANDLPNRTYDFQAPLGEIGMPNLWYHHLRLINQFLHDWGGVLSTMEPEPGHSEVRSAVRTDGKSGFVFVNNYERMKPLGTRTLEFCGRTVPVPDSSSFFFPFGLKFRSARIDWATAQPFCTAGKTIYFAAVKGIEARICIGGEELTPELDKPFRTHGITIMVMSPAKSLTAYKVSDDKVLFSDGILYTDGDRIMEESWKDEGEITAVQTAKADPARICESDHIITLPKGDELKKAASWTLELPEMEHPEDLFVAVTYRGDMAQIWADDVMAQDNFWNGRTMYVRASELVGKNVTLNILPLPKGFPVYLQKEQREELASSEEGCLCSLDSVRLIRRVRTEVTETEQKI